ncbi:putative quinol monooxygenase [Ruegeria sp. R14_0]|uniref:putative quinol monooxygenase n=1 Tax=Ruegeria sp. R14_0 TaxID=2821100 RepID=UPI001ADC17AA|nr:putative quinol monooxygenase [Ruegeria sp. R14_0]MBO9444898.1 antibiotic biosynthesis monooxygenase [Ruegeria sp. R14_0]
MSEAKVFLNGYISVPDNRIAQVRAALSDHIALTRAEPGCIAFDVAEDVEVSGRFNVSEVFENQAAFDAHQARTKASAWFKVTEGIPRDYEITME